MSDKLVITGDMGGEDVVCLASEVEQVEADHWCGIYGDASVPEHVDSIEWIDYNVEDHGDLYMHHMAGSLEQVRPNTYPVAWKFADPTEGARWLYTVAEAHEVERQDPGLVVWVDDIPTADDESSGIERYEYQVCQAYLPILISGDSSGATTEECAQARAFERKVRERHGPGHWAVVDEGVDNFMVCDISGLHGMCAELEYVVVK